MAYNFGYQYPQQYQYQSNQQSTPLIWIQGEAGAKSYMVAPGNTVALWDSESQTIYLKSADASGMPSMRILDYTIRENSTGKVNTIQTADYATKEDVISIQKQIDDIRASLKKGGRHESTVSADE